MQEQENSLQLKSLHIQLNSLDIRQKDFFQKSRKQEENILFKVKVFPMSISTYQVIAYFTLFSLWFLQLVNVYLAKYSQTFGKNSYKLNEITQGIVTLSSYGWIINGTIMFIIVVTIVLNHLQESVIFSVLRDMAAKLYKYVRFGHEILLFTTNFYAIKINAPNCTFFVFSCVLSLLATVLFQNITLRKDQFCCKSLEFSIIFRVMLIVSLTLLIVTYNMPNQLALFILMYSIQFILSIVLLIGYFSFGLIIYRKKTARYSFFIVITTYFTINFAILVDIFATIKYSYASSNLIAIFLIIFSCTQFFFISFYNRIKMDSQNPSNKNINKKVYFAFMTYQQISEDIEIQCELRGLIKDHFNEGCSNMFCMANIKQAYDAKKKKICMQSKIGQGISSIIKYYIKCIYQQGLKTNSQNVHSKIDYLQFSFFKLRKTYEVLRKIQELKLGYLSYYQQLRLQKLKESILEEANRINQNLYNRSLFLQQIIKSQQTFSIIQQLIRIILKRNQLLWKYLRSNEVFLKELLQIVEPNFSLIEKTQLFWDKISNMFKINKKWNFYYTCFCLFIRNQKLNPSLIQEFGICADLDNIFKNDNTFLDKSTQKNGVYKSSMLFQPNTCFLIAACDEQKTNIMRVSSYFQKNYQYLEEDLFNRSLSILMTPTVGRQHQKVLYGWIKEGKNHNQSLFQIKKIYPLTRQGFIRPTFKFYKMLVTLKGTMELVAMFKRNNKQQLIILASSDLKIQGATESLYSKVKINEDEIQDLRRLPLLSIIPSLIRYSSFSGSIEDNNDSFGQSYNRSYRKQKATLINPNRSDNLQILSSVEMWFPYKMDEALKEYQSIKQKTQLQGIRKFHRWLHNKKHSNKFKGGISIKKRMLGEEYYYQIEFSEIQFVQKLQKADLQNVSQQNQPSLSQSKISQQLTSTDLSVFLNLSKKKNKLLLYPSKNIFLKEEVNKLLPQIPHISNISNIARFFVIVMVGSLLAQFIVQINHLSEYYSLTRQYSELVTYQKAIYMLNSQYNIQHLQPGNAWQTSFFIIGYTHTLIHNYESFYFQSLIYDSNLNQPSLIAPQNSTITYGLTKTYTQKTYDQYQIFFKMYECAIALHRLAEVQPQNTLQILEYYEFNDYAMPFYEHCEKIKHKIEQYFYTVLDQLSSKLIIFIVSMLFLTVFFLIFAVIKLKKAVTGFQELVGIFVQIDNADNLKISKYVDFTRSLFDFLNDKMLKMMNQGVGKLSSSSAFRSMQKSSSQNLEEDRAGLEANLNKRIKRINIGYQIYHLIIKPLVILVITIVVIGVILMTLGLYSSGEVSKLQNYQQVGFAAFKYCSVHNILMNAVLQKFRNASVYHLQKYSRFLDAGTIYNKLQNKLNITLGDSDLQRNLKILYYDNFCLNFQLIFNETLTSKFQSICGDANAGWCIKVKPYLTDVQFAERCQLVQKHQLKKGLSNYMNFFLEQFLLFFHDSNQQNLAQIVQANDAYKFTDIIFAHIIDRWTLQFNTFITDFEQYSIIITICATLISILLVYFVIGNILTHELNMSYQLFRKIHENYIPEWIINKQKIIKAKLIRQGFMKD